MQILPEIEEKVLNCRLCPRLNAVTVHPAPHVCYSKDLNTIKVLGIGRNPGLECDYTNVTYQQMMEQYHKDWWDCRFGKYIRKNFGDEFVQTKFFFTNVCKCSSPNNTVLLQTEKNNCFSYLEAQIDLVNPKLIITFGNDARDIIYQKVENGRYKGKIKFLNFYHPSYFRYVKDLSIGLYQSKYLDRIKKHFNEK
ncbi:MAG: uracil-DNA glycosylase family protein [Candidatus Heimdallarchaeota archaeon]